MKKSISLIAKTFLIQSVMAEEQSILDQARVPTQCDALYCKDSDYVITRGFKSRFWTENSNGSPGDKSEILIDFQTPRTPVSILIVNNVWSAGH